MAAVPKVVADVLRVAAPTLLDVLRLKGPVVS